jgi:glutathione S-transferase
MHAGFMALRTHCTMNLWLPPKPRPATHTPEVMENLARIETIWSDCQKRYGGPFLFGKTFGNADAMYAPVVARFRNYGLPVTAETRAYMDAVMALPAWREWYDAGMKETWIMRHNEPDWPLVRGKPVE